MDEIKEFLMDYGLEWKGSLPKSKGVFEASICKQDIDTQKYMDPLFKFVDGEYRV